MASLSLDLGLAHGRPGRSGRQVPLGVRHRDDPLFCRVFEMVMAPRHAHASPAVRFNEPDQFTTVHVLPFRWRTRAVCRVARLPIKYTRHTHWQSQCLGGGPCQCQFSEVLRPSSVTCATAIQNSGGHVALTPPPLLSFHRLTAAPLRRLPGVGGLGDRGLARRRIRALPVNSMPWRAC